jgi:hypothetical protein
MFFFREILSFVLFVEAWTTLANARIGLVLEVTPKWPSFLTVTPKCLFLVVWGSLHHEFGYTDCHEFDKFIPDWFYSQLMSFVLSGV